MSLLPHSPAWARRDARRRLGKVQCTLRGSTLLDIGAAEGWVGALAAEVHGFHVQLLDVINLNQTDLPLALYDGRHIPFPDKCFDTVLLLLTLHHCADPDEVLREATRVAAGRIVVVESVYRTRAGKQLLGAMDRLYNGLRSGGSMSAPLHFKTVNAWRETFAAHGLSIVEDRLISRGLHRQTLFVLER